jgi:DNA-binding NtrC family response regulator
VSARILVVDDDASTRLVLARVLAREGYVVSQCGTVAAALEHLRLTPFEVLLTDYVMPESSGLELIATALELYPTIRCLVMSGHPRSSEAASTVSWIDKPIDLDQLFTALAP